MTDEKLQYLIETFHTMQKIVALDIFFAIYDENLTVRYLFPENGFHNKLNVGECFHDPTGKFNEVLTTGKTVHDLLPSENLGIMLEVNLVPVIEDDLVTGVMYAAYVPMNQRQLAAREWALHAIYHLILSVNADTDCFTEILWNKEFYHLLRHDNCSFSDFCMQCCELAHPDDKETFLYFTSSNFLQDAFKNMETVQMECRFGEDQSNFHWLELLITKVNNYLNESEAMTYLFMIRDIHKSKSAEMTALMENERLIKKLKVQNNTLFDQSVRDELTGLYNRKGYVHFSTQRLEAAVEQDLCLYTFTTDLNGLKYINDNFGHGAGDDAIRTISSILNDSFPPTSIIARIGGDEFVALDTFEAGSTQPQEIAHLFEENIEKFNAVSKFPFTISSSYGWDFRAARDIKNFDSCMSAADRNMYQMKFQHHLSHQNYLVEHASASATPGTHGSQVLLLCTDPETVEAVHALFDSSSSITVAKTYQEAQQYLEEAQNTILFFIDNTMEEDYCITVLNKLPTYLRQRCLTICLLEENDEIVPRIFAAGCSEALLKPYATELNRHHVNYLLRMNELYAKFAHHMESSYGKLETPVLPPVSSES